MKKEIHPKYEAARMICSCGAVYETRSTVAELHIEACAACHPFYTGRQRFVDTAGRIEKYRKKYAGDRL